MTLFEGFASLDIEVGAARIHVRTAGEGPPVLLLHGYPQTMAMWSIVAPALARHHTVVCADLRGYGRSRGPSRSRVDDFSFRTMAADQVAVMEELGHTRFDVIGHDRGGRTAHRMALDHPGRVTRLGVFDIAPTMDMLLSIDRQTAAAYWHWFLLATPAPMPESLIGADADRFFTTCFETWGATPIKNIGVEQLAEYRSAWTRPEVIHASCQDYRAALTIDLEDDLADQDRVVECPTLAAWGTRGRIAALFDLRELWERRCHSVRCEQVPGGHFFVDERPGLTADLIADFLKEPLAVHA